MTNLGAGFSVDNPETAGPPPPSSSGPPSERDRYVGRGLRDSTPPPLSVGGEVKVRLFGPAVGS